MAIKNEFNLKTTYKLIRKGKSKQNNIAALQKIETNKSNKWLTHEKQINKTCKNNNIRK
jgi:hypothetical protein